MSLIGKYLADREKEDVKKIFLWILIIATITLTIFLLFYYSHSYKEEKTKERNTEIEINNLREKDKNQNKGKDLAWTYSRGNKEGEKGLRIYSEEGSGYDREEEGEDKERIRNNSEKYSGKYSKRVRDKSENSSYNNSDKSLNNNSGINSGMSSGKNSKKGSGLSGIFKEEEEEVPSNINELILSDIKTLRRKTKNKVRAYIDYEINNFSLKESVEDNIATRNSYMEYIDKHGLSQDLYGALKADNEKDRGLLDLLKTHDRQEVSNFSY